MATGLSLHLGINDVDPDHYYGWSSPLEFCQYDAEAMHALAMRQGFQAELLTGADVTRARVVDAMAQAADRLTAGDVFLVTFAGHGGQITDVDGDEQEDKKDDTWCLWDGQLLDDEMNVLYSRFRPGVRVLVVSDSCHSGTVTKAGATEREEAEQAGGRFMPRQAARDVWRNNQRFYEDLSLALPYPRPPVRACVRLLAGCQEQQIAREHDGHGDFTRALLKLWDEGHFTGDYRAFYLALRKRMAKDQQPNQLVIGPADPEYDQQSPFTI